MLSRRSVIGLTSLFPLLNAMVASVKLNYIPAPFTVLSAAGNGCFGCCLARCLSLFGYMQTNGITDRLINADHRQFQSATVVRRCHVKAALL